MFARRALSFYETLRIVDDSLVQLATHVLGNSVIASAWFSSRNHHLNQRSPLEVLMVGDRVHDVEGASSHGIDTVVVEWGYGASDFAANDAPSPAASVATVAELREVLGV